MIRNALLGIALVTCAFSATAGNLNGYRGTAEAYVGAGRNFGDDSDVDREAPTFVGGKAFIYMPLDQEFVSHLDLGIHHSSGAVDDENDSFTHFAGVVHINYVRSGRFAIGGAAGVFGGDVLDDEDGQAYGLIAAEGRFLIERGSIWTQVGYFDSIAECHLCYQNWWHEVSYVRAGVNYFVDDNFKLALEFGHFDGYVEGQDHAPLTLTSLEAETKVDEQVSIFARYRHFYFANEDEDDPLSQHALFAGLRVRWGQGETDTLHAADFHTSIGTPDVSDAVGISDDFD